MRCISPLTINMKGLRQLVPCGKCNFCLQKKRAEWSFRLAQEQKVATSSLFLTMTYDPEHMPLDRSLVKDDHQLFLKRLRKTSPHPLRYYSVGEYGTETSRPHYHSIMFNLVPEVVKKLDSVWGKGFVYLGKVEPASIHYVTKYVINRHVEYPGREPPFATMSRRPGIGTNYLNTHTKWHRDDKRNFTKVNGVTGPLPRFYKERIFTSLERQVMALQAVHESDKAYADSIAEISQFYSDPYANYDQSIRHQHESILSKVNSLNTF